MPLVSVIIPMRNAESFISAALASILQEREVPLEVIVIDDGSTDASRDKVMSVKDERVRLIAGPCQGIAAALNAGLDAARGEIITRCDADDLYPPQRLSKQVDWLIRHPEFGAVCGGFATIDLRGKEVSKFYHSKGEEEITEELRRGRARTHFCTYAVRTEHLREIGGFRQYFKTAEDIDLQFRLGESCRIWFVPSIYYYYRLHDNSITHIQSNVEREFFQRTAYEFQKQRLAFGQDDLDRGCPPESPRGSNNLPRKSATHIQGMLIGRAWQEHQNGRKWEALKIGVRSVLTRPQTLSVWRSLAALLIKPSAKVSSRKSSISKAHRL